MGNLAEDRVTSEWRNGVFLVKPGVGLSSDFIQSEARALR